VVARRIELDSGPVTLEPLPWLSGEADRLTTDAQRLLLDSKAVVGAAGQKMERAGEVLIADPTGWDTSAVAGQVALARQLQAQMDLLDAEIAAVASKPHPGLEGVFHWLTDGHHTHELEARRAQLARQLEATLTAFAERAPTATVPEADALRSTGRELLAQAGTLMRQHESALSQARELAEEIQRRQAAAKEMGFDSLYTAAWLEAKGPQPVESPLVLKAKEQAYVSVGAGLARISTRTRYVGQSHGVSFPIGHTGIRYRVGSFSGRPVQSTSLADLDRGTLVLSNQRIAFIGRVKSVVTMLPKIVHVESYTDALAVFQEGRENPNFYKLPTPQYFLLYLNWVLAHQG
jgi:hypothetical protein